MRFNGSFDSAIANRVAQARASMFSLIKKSRRLHLTIETQLELFETTIMPIALYGCEVWGHSNLQQVEVFYKRYVKYILKLGNCTPTSYYHPWGNGTHGRRHDGSHKNGSFLGAPLLVNSPFCLRDFLMKMGIQ